MPPTKKMFTDLMKLRATDYNSPKATIGMCSQLLENRMKCHRAGDFNVVEEIPVEDKGKPGVRIVEYQVCRAHKILMEKADADLLADEAKAQEASGQTVQVHSIDELKNLHEIAKGLKPEDTVKIPVSVMHQAMGITSSTEQVEPHIPTPSEEKGEVVQPPVHPLTGQAEKQKEEVQA